MRHLSCAHTVDQILAGTKGVTRRYGWLNVKVGEQLQVIRKGQGLKKGEKVERLRVIRVTGARRERLSRLIDEPEYGREEMRREGFPDMNPQCFIDCYFKSAKDMVTRIEFEYITEETEQRR